MYRPDCDIIEKYSTYPINKFVLEKNNIIFSIKPSSNPVFCEFKTFPHCKCFQAMSGEDLVGFIFEVIGKPIIRYTPINVTLLNKKCTINNVAEASIVKLYEHGKLSIYTIYEATILSVLPFIHKVDF